jgi:hypothetical protein
MGRLSLIVVGWKFSARPAGAPTLAGHFHFPESNDNCNDFPVLASVV